MNRKTKIQSWYLDLQMIAKYWQDKRAYHHTAPISSIFALHAALGVIHEEAGECLCLSCPWARPQTA